MSNLDALHREIASLRDGLALRTEEVRQLQDAFAPVPAFPAAWKLTRAETAILGALHAAKSGVLSKAALHIATAGLEVESDEKIVDIFVCKLRQKLKRAQTGVVVETRWGFGYALGPDSRVRLSAALAGAPLEAPAVSCGGGLPASPSPAPPSSPPRKDTAMPREKDMQLPALYEPPPALDCVDVAAELLGFARARPQHRNAMVSAVRALLDGEAPPPLPQPAANGAGKKRVVRKTRQAANGDDVKAAATASAGVPAGAVTVTTEEDEECVEYAGRSMEVTAKQAQLAALLARAMPTPVAREFLVARCFPNSGNKSSADQQLSMLTTGLRAALAPLGLEVNAVRGVGIQLRPAETP